MSGKDNKPAAANNVWNDDDAAATVMDTPVAPIQPPQPQSDASLDDGRITYSCLIPVGVGGGIGAVAGVIYSAASRQPRGVCAFQGATFMMTNAGVSCLLLKQQKASFFDHNYNRVISFGASGFMWPLSGEIYRTITKMPVLAPKVAMQRSLAVGAAAALGGFIMDHWDLGRPKQPEARPGSRLANTIS